MTAPERIWLATSLKGAIADLEAMGSMSDLSVKPVQSVSHAYRAWVPADLYTAQQETIAALVEACDELRSDMLERSRAKMDVIYGEEYRVVNAGNGAWSGFCAALARAKERA